MFAMLVPGRVHHHLCFYFPCNLTTSRSCSKYLRVTAGGIIPCYRSGVLRPYPYRCHSSCVALGRNQESLILGCSWWYNSQTSKIYLGMASFLAAVSVSGTTLASTQEVMILWTLTSARIIAPSPKSKPLALRT